MRIKTVREEILPLILVIPLVVLLFRFIPERKIAATIAGLLFVVVPAALMWKRARSTEVASMIRWVWWFGVLQFWMFFALPILGARVLFWETAFEEFSFFGQTGETWHRLASKSYMVMMVAVLFFHLWSWWFQKQKAGSSRLFETESKLK